MIGDVESYSLDSEDDNLHVPTELHPLWTETFWLSFGIPDRRMHVSIYPWFRKNIGMQAGGVLVWDPSSDLPWDLAFCEYDYHIPLDPDLDLRNAQLSNGLSLTCLETQQAYRVRYEHEDLKIDVTFRGLMPPQVSGRDGRPNHLDQPGHVVGEIVLRGDLIGVDGPGMRDRSWSVRLDATRVGYAWGTTAGGDSFLSLSLPHGDEERICDGYLLPRRRAGTSGGGNASDGSFPGAAQHDSHRSDRCTASGFCRRRHKRQQNGVLRLPGNIRVGLNDAVEHRWSCGVG